MQKNLFISGGGDEKQSFQLDEEFFSLFPQNGCFLYVPIALRGEEIFLSAPNWMKGVIDLHNRNDIGFDVVDDPGEYHFEKLSRYDGIYIGGGNTWNLTHELRVSGLDKAIIQYTQSGGLVYGGSAGAIIFGRKINTHDDENTPQIKDFSGLDLMNGYSVACHFVAEQQSRFMNWSIENQLPIICLPEDSGLIVSQDEGLCVGESPCFVYIQNGSMREVKPGEQFSLSGV